MRISHVPLRLATGAFILNSGLVKRAMPPEAAAGLHGMAAGAIPQVAGLKPTTFKTALSTGEVLLGAALLSPFVSPVVAGAALTAFSVGLVQLYVKTPGLHEPGSIRPTQDGTAIAKDVWMLGTGLALLADGLIDNARDAAHGVADGARSTAKSARRAAKDARKAARRALP